MSVIDNPCGACGVCRTLGVSLSFSLGHQGRKNQSSSYGQKTSTVPDPSLLQPRAATS